MSLAVFLFQSNFCLLVFYSFYRLFLYKETFFLWNRVYLISTLCFALFSAILRFEWLSRSSVSRELQSKMLDVVVQGRVGAGTDFDWMQWTYRLYFLGAMLSMLWFLYKLWILKSRLENPQTGQAFSFFGFKRIDSALPDFEMINRHEEVHIRQFHSIDVLLMELAAVLLWFNPVIYLYKSSIKNIHEYLADEAAAEFEGSKRNYALLLLHKAMGLSPDLTNSFLRQSEIKKRLLMLQRERSDKRALWKYLWLVPLLSSLLFFSSAIKETKSQVKIASRLKEKTAPAEFGKEDNVKQDDGEKENEQKGKDADNYGAEFPGGLSKFTGYLIAETKYPKAEFNKGLEGSVIVSFVVEKDGAITEVVVKKGISPALDKEAIRVISNSPNWIPGKQNGTPVRIKHDIRLNFKR
ncbi:hypothetical protein AQ505_17730 [Pedobacter sp. PACM 27299]|uniref:M56 family metallopeptidase n=1 Tax=Pedobacter sp. PACM 27299 TaxID=1727164 RepID=UPI0007063D8C|nr:M56 family metallopeptidase [Pedobacter sp. PACM 27299]ALL07165.1 hypothetical protein AQ505_17730 [Pedobacter sp. PACM 27299]